jgi:predicted Zn-dependent protease
MTGRRLIASAVLALATVALAAQAPSPVEQGMRYEMEGRWDAAVAAYESVLAQQPGREDLWLRISDIRARQGQPEEAAQATEKAVALHPEDDTLWLRLSQEYAMANRPKEAQAAIEHAVALKPDNPDYLRSAAELASWNGDYASATRRPSSAWRGSSPGPATWRTRYGGTGPTWASIRTTNPPAWSWSSASRGRATTPGP